MGEPAEPSCPPPSACDLHCPLRSEASGVGAESCLSGPPHLEHKLLKKQGVETGGQPTLVAILLLVGYRPTLQT